MNRPVIELYLRSPLHPLFMPKDTLELARRYAVFLFIAEIL